MTNVPIDEGLIRFDKYMQSIEEYKTEKEEIITDQKLFNLPISKYEKISAVEGRLKHLTPIMDIYRRHEVKMEKFRASGWKQLNQKDYRDHSEVIKKEVAKLNRGKKYDSESQ